MKKNDSEKKIIMHLGEHVEDALSGRTVFVPCCRAKAKPEAILNPKASDAKEAFEKARNDGTLCPQCHLINLSFAAGVEYGIKMAMSKIMDGFANKGFGQPDAEMDEDGVHVNHKGNGTAH